MTLIAICAPGTPIDRETALAVTRLAEKEFPQVRLAFHDQCFAEHGHFAGEDAVRLAALLECANDPAVDAVWLAKGGYGTNRIAADAVAGMTDAARRKLFLGYSDGGYLLAALYRAGVGRPVHGAMAVDIRREGGEAAIRRALAYIAGGRDGLESSLGSEPTVAFNLTTLAMLSGTDLMPDLTGHVVMVEEVGEYLYAVDRLFFHLLPNLRAIAGLRLGRVSAVPVNDRPFGMSVEEIARFWCERAGVPFLGGANIGHDAENRIVPFGLAGLGARS